MKIEKITREEIVQELTSLMVDNDGMEELEAIKKMVKMDDNRIIEVINMYYDGTGVRFNMVKIK